MSDNWNFTVDEISYSHPDNVRNKKSSVWVRNIFDLLLDHECCDCSCGNPTCCSPDVNSARMQCTHVADEFTWLHSGMILLKPVVE